MPQGDDEASTVKEPLIDTPNAVVTNLNAAEVLQPGVGPFDFPSPSITTQLSFVFEAALFSGVPDCCIWCMTWDYQDRGQPPQILSLVDSHLYSIQVTH
jgi:hypothetical protein